MRKLFYPKLAFSNMKKNYRLYIPYLLTCIGIIMMYYIISALANNESLKNTYGGEEVKSFLDFGAWVIGFFAVIFLFYTHSFVMKQRKKEFGLFLILGMEKRHISKVIFVETIYTAAISLALGLGLGVLFSKLMELALFGILHFEVQMGIEIVPESIAVTVCLFSVIFLLTLLNSLRQIHLTNPIELLQGANAGEREPKTKWLLSIIGFLTLGGGYYLSLAIQDPVAAIFGLFIAIILVMIGTYCLFTAGSITILKALKKNKRFYYQIRHFTSISGMMYRMKKNAVGLANICILCTGVLIMLSTTFSLYMGMEDLLRSRYPRDILVYGSDMSEEQVELIRETVNQVKQQYQFEPQQVLNYRNAFLSVNKEGDDFTKSNDDAGITGNNLVTLYFVPLEDYNSLNNTKVELAADEVLIDDDKGLVNGEVFKAGSYDYKIKERINFADLNTSALDSLLNNISIIVPDMETMQEIFEEGFQAPFEYSYYYGFDTNETAETEIAICQEINNSIQNTKLETEDSYLYAEGAENSRESFYTLYGSLLFLGIFLGVLFIIATVLIIYYKQITEGFEDKTRFEIMQKVGMSRREVKESIRSQVLAVFFLPLLAGGVHTAFAYPIIKKILMMLNMSNTVIFLQTSLVVGVLFTILYVVVYSLTARSYYKIVYS